MRCKKHPADFSSAVGVCASCLRERLLAIMAAQAQTQVMQAQLQLAQDRGDCRIKTDTTHYPPSLAFPRSVSPYISRRKSDNAPAWQIHGHRDQRFYGTPQVGPTGSMTVEIERGRKKSNGGVLFSLLSGLFKSKRGKTRTDASGPTSDPSVSDSGPGFSSRDPRTSSPSWLSAALPSRRKKVNTFPIDVSVAGDRRRAWETRGRGMSPERFSDDEDYEHCRRGSSGYSSESPQGWRQTPRRTPASTRSGGGRAAPNKNMAGLTFCLSPLVRASPNRHRNQKGALPELMTAAPLGGDTRGPPKAHLSAASSFCKNRSRKLADFGRYNPNN